MDDPPPPYSSIDTSKSAGYPPNNFYPAGPPPQNQYGATSYPSATAYQRDPHLGSGPASSMYTSSAETQPQYVIAPVGFARFGRVQTIRQRYATFSTHILLSCFVLCCCGPVGFMCGLLAFCVAICAQSFDESSPQLSRQLGTASMTLSMAGIAVSLLTVVLVVSTGGFHVHPDNFTAAGNNTLDDCLFPVRDRCFNSRKLVRSMKYCYDGYYLNRYCYRREQIMH